MVRFFESQSQGVSLTGNGDSLVSDGWCQHHTKPTHTSHSRTRDFFSRGSRLESSSQQESLYLTKQLFFTSSTACRTHTCALLHFPHARQSDLPLDHLQDLSRCLLHTETYPAQIHRNVSFGPLAETHSPAGYETKDLTEEDTSILVKPMFFHKPSMTSTYDSAESIATPPPESDLE